MPVAVGLCPPTAVRRIQRHGQPAVHPQCRFVRQQGHDQFLPLFPASAYPPTCLKPRWPGCRSQQSGGQPEYPASELMTTLQGSGCASWPANYPGRRHLTLPPAWPGCRPMVWTLRSRLPGMNWISLIKPIALPSGAGSLMPSRVARSACAGSNKPAAPPARHRCSANWLFAFALAHADGRGWHQSGGA